jgi:transcription antitermination protein NusB
MSIISPSARHKARHFAVQAIYQWQFGTTSIEEIHAHFSAKNNPKKVDVEYFAELLMGVVNNQAVIDEQIIPFLDRDITDLDHVELAILRIATYELLFRLDVPYKVIINEALELTKVFGSKEGFKYVNGILDNVAKKVRIETKQL